MKTTVYAWGAQVSNVLHIYAGMTTQKDLGIRINGVKQIIDGAADSRIGGPQNSAIGAWNLDLIYADSSQNYSRHKEQRAINAGWAVEQKYRNASLPVRSLNSNRAVGLGSVQKYLDRTNSVYGHVLLHDTELDTNLNGHVFQAVESWIKEKVQEEPNLKRKFETIIKAKSKKEAMIKNITKVLGLEPVLA